MIELLEMFHEHAPKIPTKHAISFVPPGLPKKKIRSQLQDMKDLYNGLLSNPIEDNLKTKYEHKWPKMREDFFIALEKCLGLEVINPDSLAQLKDFLPTDFENLIHKFK